MHPDITFTVPRVSCVISIGCVYSTLLQLVQFPPGKPRLHLLAILALWHLRSRHDSRLCASSVRNLSLLFLSSVQLLMYLSLAGIGARILLTAWSAYAIWRTHHLSSVYRALLSDPGTPCSVDFFPIYFSTRSSLEIPDLVLNLTALSIMIWTVLRVCCNFTCGFPLND